MGSWELLERKQAAEKFHKTVLDVALEFKGQLCWSKWTFSESGIPVERNYVTGQVVQGPKPCSELGTSRSTVIPVEVRSSAGGARQLNKTDEAGSQSGPET